jgi:hypothetical protein
MWKIACKIPFMFLRKHGFHCTDVDETRSLVALHGDLVYHLSCKMAKKYGKYR